MRPRKAIDIGWIDIAYAVSQALSDNHRAAQAKLEHFWETSYARPHNERVAIRPCLATFSVRTGIDLFLETMNWPVGSEIIVSGVNIADMQTIIQHHGLVPIQADICRETGTLLPSWTALLSAKTKAILFAHLLGHRNDLDSIAEIAKKHSIILIEDCAQAFLADGYQGSPFAEISLFSFGPIKTHTALGGAMLTFGRSDLCQRVREKASQHSTQPYGVFLKKLLKYSALKILGVPAIYGAFVKYCQIKGLSHDRIINQSARSFAGQDLIAAIRHQPSAALLKLLHWRLVHADQFAINERIRIALEITKDLPLPAQALPLAREKGFWLLAVLADPAPDLVGFMTANGIDATKAASSMCTVGQSKDGAGQAELF